MYHIYLPLFSILLTVYLAPELITFEISFILFLIYIGSITKSKTSPLREIGFILTLLYPFTEYLAFENSIFVVGISAIAIIYSILIESLPSLIISAKRNQTVIFLTPFLFLNTLAQWSAIIREPDGDEPYYLLITHSLAYDLDFELSNNYLNKDYLNFISRDIEPQSGDPTIENKIYSRHSLLLPAITALPYKVGGIKGVLIILALISSLTSLGIYKLATQIQLKYVNRIYSWFLFSFLLPTPFYASQVWIESLAALLLIFAIYNYTKKKITLSIFLSLILIVAKLRFIPLAIFYLLDKKTAVKSFTLIGSTLGLILLFNKLFFTKLFKVYTFAEAIPNLFALSTLNGLIGLFLDCAFGLLPFAPIYFLGFTGQKRIYIKLKPYIPGIVVYFLLIASRQEWYGGWSPPFRYGYVTVPILSIITATTFYTLKKKNKNIMLSLLYISYFLSALFSIFPQLGYSLATGSSTPLEYISFYFKRDFISIFPSFIRWRTSNLVWIAVLFILIFTKSRIFNKKIMLSSYIIISTIIVTTFILPNILPTRLVEFEDSWIEKSGGTIYPERWIENRVRFKSGWTIWPKAVIRIPIVCFPTKRIVSAKITYKHLTNTNERYSLIKINEKIFSLPKTTRWREETLLIEQTKCQDLIITNLSSIDDILENSIVFDKMLLLWK